MKKKKPPSAFSSLRLGQMALSLGINFVLWCFVGFYLGSKLDKKLGTDPWLMIVGILLGVAFSFYGFIKEILLLGKLNDNSKPKDD
jgi:ATP synthase protein I